MDYVLEKFDARWGDEETGPKDEAQVADIIETTREDLLKAVRATRYDIAKVTNKLFCIDGSCRFQTLNITTM